MTTRPAPTAYRAIQSERGYHVAYRPGERNSCPGCSKSQWNIGRTMAECCFCGTALDLPDSSRGGGSIVTMRRRA